MKQKEKTSLQKLVEIIVSSSLDTPKTKQYVYKVNQVISENNSKFCAKCSIIIDKYGLIL